MTTLTELNGKVWYRFFKVIFILCYLPYFLLLFIIFEVNKDYHHPILPNSVKEVFNDSEFYKLGDHEMIDVITSIEKNIIIKDTDEQDIVPFNDLFVNDQLELLKSMKKQPIPTTPLPKKYKYTSYYTYNITKYITYGLILTICYILFMECIRRGFYYIVIGKVFPKE